MKNLIDKKKRDTSKMMKCVVIYRRYKIVCNMRTFSILFLGRRTVEV